MPTNSRKTRRVVLTAVLAVTMLVAFASLGGVSIATSAIGAAQYQYGKKVTICHKGKTITVAKQALKAHRKHGDTVGRCTTAQVRKAKAAVAKAKAKAAKKAKAQASAKASKKAAPAKSEKAKPTETSTTQTSKPGNGNGKGQGNGNGNGNGKGHEKGNNGKGKGRG